MIEDGKTKKIKILRSDNGTEYKNSAMTEYVSTKESYSNSQLLVLHNKMELLKGRIEL